MITILFLLEDAPEIQLMNVLENINQVIHVIEIETKARH